MKMTSKNEDNLKNEDDLKKKTTSNMKITLKMKTTLKMKMTYKKKTSSKMVPPFKICFCPHPLHHIKENFLIFLGPLTSTTMGQLIIDQKCYQVLKPEMIHDKYNIRGIMHVRTYRKDNIFMQRRLLQSFPYS